MHNISLHLQCIQFNNNKIHRNDKIKVTLFSYPGDDKQTYIVDAKKMKDADYFFSTSIDCTKSNPKILLTFEKKSFLLNDVLIASSIIKSNQIPKSQSDPNNKKIAIFNLYQPIESNDYRIINQFDNCVVGKMLIQFSFDEKVNKSGYNIEKIHNGEGYSPVNSFINENQNNYNLLDY